MNKSKSISVFISAVCVLSAVNLSLSKPNQSCNLGGWDCSKNETCKQQVSETSQVGRCECKNAFYQVGDLCLKINETSETVTPPSTAQVVDPEAYSGESGVSLWLVIPCVLIVLLSTLVLLARRYKWTEKLYQFRIRRYNTVFINSSLHDDVAPIS